MHSDTMTKRHLIAGTLLAPVFYGISFLLAAVTDGFDLRKQAISALSLGEYGWVQKTNFVISGILVILSARGFRNRLKKGRAALAGPALTATVGTGLIVAGLFSTDPAFGFPKGAPEGMPLTMSPNAALHGVGFYGAFTALTVAPFVFARRFLSAGERGWGLYCAVTGLVTPLLIGLGMTAFRNAAGIVFAVAGLVGMGWLSIVAYRFSKDSTE